MMQKPNDMKTIDELREEVLEALREFDAVYKGYREKHDSYEREDEVQGFLRNQG